MPNLTQLKDTLRNLQNEMRDLVNKGTALMADPNASAAQLTQHTETINAMQARINLARAAVTQEEQQQQPVAQAAAAKQQPAGVTAMLKSNEYARAFATALRNRVHPAQPCSDESLKVLYDALTESGGNPAGSEGGFLVPDDVDRQIRERMRALNPLRDLFGYESVSYASGTRIMDTAPDTGLTMLAGENPVAGIAEDDQPAFSPVNYSLATYGLIVPVSRELAADESANLFGYLARWYGKKQVLTENFLLRAVLDLLVAGPITADDDMNAIAQLKSVLNVSLDPAISQTATILTNQSGFDYLDNIVDGLGRPLLQPDPASGTPMLLKTHPIKVMSNRLLPSRVEAVGPGAGEYYPIYVGDFSQYATLFERMPLEMVSTDIGGQAFTRNRIDVRGISRLGVSRFDVDTVVRREIFVPET
ncbi:MAG: phage major capsid protein [Clostridiales bacterium]|nr:phage major capsid protein [Clostridiales bacterium]